MVVGRAAGASPRAERARRVAHGESETGAVAEAEPVVRTRPVAGAIVVAEAVLAAGAMVVAEAVVVVRAALIVGAVAVVGAEAAEDVVAACCPGHDVLLKGLFYRRHFDDISPHYR
ncbi:MAG: hypothetical protein ACRDZY_18285, partial [Acidimicrobiales bacterium]